MKHASARARAGLSLSMIIFGTIPLFTRSMPLSSSTLALSRAVLAACSPQTQFTLPPNTLQVKNAKKILVMKMLFSNKKRL